MGRFRLFIKSSAKKELAAIPTKKERQRIVRPIEGLADDPRPLGCQKLSGYDRYRVRQGNYRIVYGIREDEILVIRIKTRHR